MIVSNLNNEKTLNIQIKKGITQMKLNIIIIFVSILSFTFGCNESNDNCNNGGIWEKGNLINGEKNGEWTFYNCDGYIWKVGHFLNGIEHGEFSYYGYYGKFNTYHKKKTEHYKHGKLNGEYTHYYESGNIISIANYNDGLQVGSYIFYEENGNIYWAGNYENGKLVEVIEY